MSGSAELKEKVFRYLKQPTTLQGINVLANVAALKFGVSPDAVLAGGALVAGLILVLQDEDKKGGGV